METGQLIVPAKLVKTYAEKVQLRDRATRSIARLEKLLSNLAAHVAKQLASRDLLGREGMPNLECLPSFPQEVEPAVLQMTDKVLVAAVARLSTVLNRPLAINMHGSVSSTASLPKATPSRPLSDNETVAEPPSLPIDSHDPIAHEATLETASEPESPDGPGDLTLFVNNEPPSDGPHFDDVEI